MKATKILVPLDGSTLAEAALPRALELATASGAPLVLLRATQARAFPGADPIEAQLEAVRESEAYLVEVAARLEALGARDVRRAVWYGAPAPAIIDAAAFNQADLIVMTTHGRSGLGRLVMGSVAESVLRGTRVPILLLRDGTAPLAAAAGTAKAA